MLPRVVLRLEWGLFRLDRDEGRACSRPSPNPARFTAFCDLAEEAAAPIAVSYTHLDVYKRQVLPIPSD